MLDTSKIEDFSREMTGAIRVYFLRFLDGFILWTISFTLRKYLNFFLLFNDWINWFVDFGWELEIALQKTVYNFCNIFTKIKLFHKTFLKS